MTRTTSGGTVNGMNEVARRAENRWARSALLVLPRRQTGPGSHVSLTACNVNGGSGRLILLRLGLGCHAKDIERTVIGCLSLSPGGASKRVSTKDPACLAVPTESSKASSTGTSIEF